MDCTACGFAAPADFAFCPKCGQRLAAAAPGAAQGVASATPGRADSDEADRRPATVLFADLSGFTALSESLDPEEVRALQTELFVAMSAAIRRFDGFVEKYVGDAVMAVFGAPVAHDDDPERALRAALAMHDRVDDLGRKWMPRLGRPLALHIGINTGPVVAGHLGSHQDAAYAVTGDTVNTAARLQSAAGPGQTLASHSTVLLAQHAFEFEAAGELVLKGKAQPMTAYRVRAALGRPRAARGLHDHGLAMPFVGREAELGSLGAAFERMLAGQSQHVSIVGDAGTGKSRLLAAFLAQLGSQGRLCEVLVRSAACSSLGGSALGVPAALLRDAYDITPDDAAGAARRKVALGVASLGIGDEDARQLVALLSVVLGLEADRSALRHLDPEQIQRQIFSALFAVVERRLRRSALLYIVEDLHWADAASLELLRFLLDRLAGRRFMLLTTSRSAPGLDALADPAAGHRMLRLEPLSSDHSAALLAGLFGADSGVLPGDLRARIVERAGGNPLFLEEMVRTLIADGALRREGDAWSLRAQSGLVSVPSTIHGLLLGRLDRLPAPARRALQEAAVIGPEFSEALLRSVASEQRPLSQALAALTDAGLISSTDDPDDESAGGRFRFRHALIHEVAYQNLLARRRTELHTRIGETLERLCGGSPRRLEELQALGHHFRLGADKARGARYLVAAADWARGIYANTDAIRQYELALETLQQCGEDDAVGLDVEERLGDVLVPAGQIAAAWRHFEKVRAAHARSGDAPAEARVLRKLAASHWERGDRAEARRCLEAALALIDDVAHIERARLHQEMGQLAFRSGDNVEALQWTQRALDQVDVLTSLDASAPEQAARAAALALALNTQGAALARMDRLPEAVARLERSVAVARAADLPQMECRALSNLGVLYSSRDPQRAIEACERGLQTARRIGDVGLQSRLYANLAVAYCTLTNRCDEQGVGAANAAIEIDRNTGQLDHLAVSLVVLAQIHQCHGDPARALDHYREALALAEQSGEPQLLFPCYDGLATLHLDLDDAETAQHYMQLARSTCERAGLDADALIVLPFLA